MHFSDTFRVSFHKDNSTVSLSIKETDWSVITIEMSSKEWEELLEKNKKADQTQSHIGLEIPINDKVTRHMRIPRSDLNKLSATYLLQKMSSGE